ncbi:MAG: hypothetical protein N3F09_08625 [Bacteroidia bacterium]|nr:hypothetical protein [Bacteroidia bacterium]
MFARYIGSFSSKATVAFINFLVLLFTSRYLGPGTRGEISLWLLDIFIIQMAAEIITGYSLVHFIPKVDFKIIYKTGFFFSLIILLLSVVIFLLIKKNFEWEFFGLVFMVILNSFHFVFFLGYGDIKSYNWISILQPFLLLFGIIVMVFGFELTTFRAWKIPMFFSFGVTLLFTAYVLFFKTQKSNQVNGNCPLADILKNGFLSQSANLFFVLANRYNYWQIEDLGKVGIYSTASTLAESLMIFSTAMAPLLLSDISLGKQEKLRFHQFLVVAGMVLISIVFIFFIPEEFILKVVGKSFVGIKGIILLLSAGVFLNSQTSIMHHFFSAKGNLVPAFISNFTGFLVTILFASFAYKKLGLHGLALLADSAYFSVFLVTFFWFMLKTSHHE